MTWSRLSADPARREAQLQALRLGPAVRTRRARLLSELADAGSGPAGRALTAAHLDAPDPAIACLPVVDVLVACRGVGRIYARRLLARARVDAARRVGDLTDREVRDLAAALAQPRPYEQPAEPAAIAA